MALVEIDDATLAAQQQVVSTMQKLLNNPKTRRQILQAQKELDPNLVIPELDVAEPFRGEISEVRSTLAELQKSLAEERAEREAREARAQLQERWNSGRSKLRANGYTDEGMSEVEKFMEEKGIADHEIAAAAFERLHPPSEPVRSVGSNRFDIFEPENRSSEHMKALFANPDDSMALDALINDTLRQVRGR